MEMHLVHFKADLHDISEASEKDNLAVLGIFFKVSTNPLFLSRLLFGRVRLRSLDLYCNVIKMMSRQEII